MFVLHALDVSADSLRFNRADPSNPCVYMPVFAVCRSARCTPGVCAAGIVRSLVAAVGCCCVGAVEPQHILCKHMGPLCCTRGKENAVVAQGVGFFLLVHETCVFLCVAFVQQSTEVEALMSAV